MKKIFPAALLSLAALGASGAAFAAVDESTLNVKLTITSSCNIVAKGATDLDFGTVASTAVNILATGGVISATCTPGSSIDLGLETGKNFSGTRRLTDGTNFVPYELYRDAGRTLPWGSTKNTDTLKVLGSGKEETITVYGKVPSANFPAGTYTDQVVVRVIY